MKISQKLEAELQARAKSGSYVSVEALLQAALSALDRAESEIIWLEERVKEGMESGAPVPFGQIERETLRKQVRDREQAG